MVLSRAFESRAQEFSNRVFASTIANLVYDDGNVSVSGEAAVAQSLSTSTRAQAVGAADPPTSVSATLERMRRYLLV